MKKTSARQSSRGAGRPSKDEAEGLRDRILDAAEHIFFTEGYGSASIEAIAHRARTAKRTIYDRFRNKADLFRAVVHRIIGRLSVSGAAALQQKTADLEQTLQTLARVILQASLQPETLALNRLIFAEAARFPELALIVHEQGARQRAVQYICGILEKEKSAGRLKVKDSVFAAEQFLQLVTSLPQRRAFGIGKPMTQRELAAWPRDTVDLFLKGCGG